MIKYLTLLKQNKPLPIVEIRKKKKSLNICSGNFSVAGFQLTLTRKVYN